MLLFKLMLSLGRFMEVHAARSVQDASVKAPQKLPDIAEPQPRFQPHPLTSVMQMTMTFCALCVAACAIFVAIRTVQDDRNARLVEIGVGILRVDPGRETQVAAAREWALDLIDANAGVRFSSDVRQSLLQKKLASAPLPAFSNGWQSLSPDVNSKPLQDRFFFGDPSKKESNVSKQEGNSAK